MCFIFNIPLTVFLLFRILQPSQAVATSRDPLRSGVEVFWCVGAVSHMAAVSLFTARLNAQCDEIKLLCTRVAPETFSDSLTAVVLLLQISQGEVCLRVGGSLWPFFP
jgi:hypothetical protein